MDSVTLVSGNTILYGCFTVVSVALGRSSGPTDSAMLRNCRCAGMDVWKDLSGPLDVVGGVMWCLPMVGIMLITAAVSDRVPEFLEIKRLLQTTIVPLLRKMPPWVHLMSISSQPLRRMQGPLALALGAGIGEEALFRGWMQPALAQQLLMIDPDVASFCGIAGSSVVFGLAHAVTPTYFLWATVFGAWMGVECLSIGLPAAAMTHALYDWIAFVSLKELWKPEEDTM